MDPQYMVEAELAANIHSVVLTSSAGCDMAEHDSQPRLREFVDIGAKAMWEMQ